jgi:NADPH:quinone reductase-like Zn-dependent oxidoreductase
MKALVVDRYGAPRDARIADVSVPKVQDGYLLVRMHAAGVNPFDYKLVTGAVKDWMPIEFPYIPGMDGAGEVVEVGSGVQGWRKGDALFGMFRGGTFAQYALVRAEEKRLARKPDALDYERAAAIPQSALTALTMVRTADIKPGQRVLVVGATGGLGLFLTQFAKQEGAMVAATGTRDDAEYVRGLGADDVIDYRARDTFAQAQSLGGFDVILDVVNSGDALLHDAQALRTPGTIVSSLGGPEQSAFPAGVQVHYIQMRARRGDLDDIARRAADGSLRVEIGGTYELSQAAQALADLSDRTKHTRGKLVVRIP